MKPALLGQRGGMHSSPLDIGEKALQRVTLHANGERDPYGEGSFPRPVADEVGQ